MRPNKIIMSAFGPYAGRVEVDLDKLGQNGIYLITGDTGAGKTTIFDAITYALYGEASGDNRETSMFRSKYAEADTPTEVELYFTCNGKEYYVKRNPEYERPRARGEGTTPQKANAQLTLPDGKLVTKLKEVNNAIAEIIGIDRNQFTQIAMIAQGDFLKLLLATTDERKKIFQKLFKTQNYYVLQEKLKTESGVLSREYDALKKSIEQYINGIVCDSSVKATIGDLTAEEITLLLGKLITEDESVEKQLEEEKAELKKKLDQIKEVISKAEDVLSAKRDLEKNISELQLETDKQREFTEKLQIQKNKLGETKELAEKTAAIKATLQDYDELTEKTKSYDNNKKFIDKSGKMLSEIEGIIKNITDEIVALTEELKTLDKAGEDKIKFENEKNKQEEQQAKLIRLGKDIEALEKLSNEFSKAHNLYMKRYQEATALDTELKEKTRIYLEAQAGILADTLEVNKPCPVCGSTEHPKIAEKPTDVPTKAELDGLQEKLSVVNNKVNDAREDAGKRKGTLTEKEETIQKEIAQSLGEYLIEDAKFIIGEKVKELNVSIDELSKMISAAQSKINRKTEIEKILPKKNSDIETTKEKLTKLSDDVKIKSAENLSLEKRISELRAKLAFETKLQAQKEIDSIVAMVTQIEKDYDRAVENVNKCEQKIASLKAAKEEIAKRIGSSCDVDLAKAKETRQAFEVQEFNLENRAKTVHSRIIANKTSLNNILQKIDEINSVEKKWMWVKALSNTANGSITGREKIMLETYIQLTYFDRIIERANTRFMVLSGGQYELKRRVEAANNRSQTGLELNVIDHYNGTERSVKTLSGGESFKASLSLALGLSDEIQSSAGGIKLDTMFVDEGFGSLDEESLAQAIKVLASLADGNRLVGIISHVGELKSRIDKQIVVRKEKTGGSKITIVS